MFVRTKIDVAHLLEQPIKPLTRWTPRKSEKPGDRSGLEMLRHTLQVPLGVDGGHAAGAGGGDGLAVDVVLDVAAREDARHARLGAVVGDEVAVGVHLELT